MKKTLLFLFTISFFCTLQAQFKPLSSQAEVSVLTIGSGDALYDTFGHSAFRIKDVNQNLDVTFDYGRYDFGAPNFYLKFAQGKLNYQVGAASYNSFINLYVSQDRKVTEQVLNLTKKEKEALYRFLIKNYRPENRNYLYDFFFDNCATKIKDVANANLNNSISFENPDNLENHTFRSLIHSHVNKNTWGSFGIDIALGSVIDRDINPENYMFLPVYINDFFDVAKKSNGENLVASETVINEGADKKYNTNFFFSPLFIFGIISLLIIYITYKDHQNNKRTKWLDFVLFTVTGIIGVVLLLLWFATDHSATAHNYNLLWAFPLNVFIGFTLLKQKPKQWIKKYLKLLVILLCLMTLHWTIGVQVFAIALIPLLIAFAIRYIFLIKNI